VWPGRRRRGVRRTTRKRRTEGEVLYTPYVRYWALYSVTRAPSLYRGDRGGDGRIYAADIYEEMQGRGDDRRGEDINGEITTAQRGRRGLDTRNKVVGRVGMVVVEGEGWGSGRW
jgi:hypothetical protein